MRPPRDRQHRIGYDDDLERETGIVTAAEGAIGEGVRLAVQRSGRLTEASLALLRNAGFTFESYSDRLFARCRNFPLAILFGRDDDIPEYVTSSTVDLGIVGHNLIVEEGAEERVDERLSLGFGYCSLVLAVPKDSGISSPRQLAGATEILVFSFEKLLH